MQYLPKVMGILNVTPDSFYDGGRYQSVAAALDHAARLVEEGADMIDVGGESSRPGAHSVSVEQEIERVVPVLEALRDRFPVTLSIDTRQPQVMTAALAAGATFINDITALRAPGALDIVSASTARVCLMHMQGEPFTMQDAPHYDNVIIEVRDFLIARVEACLAAGIARERIVIDPGFGFGKRLEHNLQLLNHLDDFTTLGLPILVGLSRKAMIGQILGYPLDRRLYGSVSLALIAALKGATILRVHDVRPTVDTLKIVLAVQGY